MKADSIVTIFNLGMIVFNGFFFAYNISSPLKWLQLAFVGAHTFFVFLGLERLGH